MSEKLRAENLGVRADGSWLLRGVDLTIGTGETLAVVGPSGAGKSTLLRLCNRLVEPTEGTVYLDGTDYREVPPTGLRTRIGMVPQKAALRDGTVAENVGIGPRLRGDAVDEDRVADLLARVDLAGYGDRPVGGLSGGEAQRVAIARTVMVDPEVLLLDEPTASLDSDAEREVERLLSDLLASGERTAVLVTHDDSQAGRLADRVARLGDGSLQAVGRPAEVIV